MRFAEAKRVGIGTELFYRRIKKYITVTNIRIDEENRAAYFLGSNGFWVYHKYVNIVEDGLRSPQLMGDKENRDRYKLILQPIDWYGHNISTSPKLVVGIWDDGNKAFREQETNQIIDDKEIWSWEKLE